MSVKEHQFYVCVCKDVFMHKKLGIVRSYEPIPLSELHQYHLTPVIMYGLAIQGTSVRWSCYSDYAQPQDLGRVLIKAWTEFPALKGKPDVLKVSKKLYAFAPGLESALRSIGVKLQVADSKEKSLPANMHGAMSHASQAFSMFGREKRRCTDVRHLSDLALARHCQDMEWVRHEINVSVREATVRHLKQVGESPVPGSMPAVVLQTGDWMSPWNKSLELGIPRCVTIKARTGEVFAEVDQADNGLDAEENEQLMLALEEVRDIIRCWPGGMQSIAKAVGLSQAELQKGLAARKATQEFNATGSVLNRVFDLLGFDDEDGFLTQEKPRVLLAEKLKHAERGYDIVSHGGDLQFSFEVSPEGEGGDPSWQYILFQRCFAVPYIMMIPRGIVPTDRLERSFINCSGHTQVPKAFYQEMVKICGKICASPEKNELLFEEWIDKDSTQGVFDDLKSRY